MPHPHPQLQNSKMQTIMYMILNVAFSTNHIHFILVYSYISWLLFMTEFSWLLMTKIYFAILLIQCILLLLSKVRHKTTTNRNNVLITPTGCSKQSFHSFYDFLKYIISHCVGSIFSFIINNMLQLMELNSQCLQ